MGVCCKINGHSSGYSKNKKSFQMTTNKIFKNVFFTSFQKPCINKFIHFNKIKYVYKSFPIVNTELNTSFRLISKSETNQFHKCLFHWWED